MFGHSSFLVFRLGSISSLFSGLFDPDMLRQLQQITDVVSGGGGARVDVPTLPEEARDDEELPDDDGQAAECGQNQPDDDDQQSWTDEVQGDQPDDLQEGEYRSEDEVQPQTAYDPTDNSHLEHRGNYDDRMDLDEEGQLDDDDAEEEVVTSSVRQMAGREYSQSPKRYRRPASDAESDIEEERRHWSRRQRQAHHADREQRHDSKVGYFR